MYGMVLRSRMPSLVSMVYFFHVSVEIILASIPLSTFLAGVVWDRKMRPPTMRWRLLVSEQALLLAVALHTVPALVSLVRTRSFRCSLILIDPAFY